MRQLSSQKRRGIISILPVRKLRRGAGVGGRGWGVPTATQRQCGELGAVCLRAGRGAHTQPRQHRAEQPTLAAEERTEGDGISCDRNEPFQIC